MNWYVFHKSILRTRRVQYQSGINPIYVQSLQMNIKLNIKENLNALSTVATTKKNVVLIVSVSFVRC